MDNYNQQPFSNYTVLSSEPTSAVLPKKFMASVFLWMAVALGVSAACAFLFASNDALFQNLVNPLGGMSTLGWVVMFAPLGFVMMMSFGFARLSAPTLVVLFVAYAAITGVSMSFILRFYTQGSVTGTFLSASTMFGIMAVMGYTTEKDLTSFGRILTMGLIGLCIAWFINFILRSEAMSYIISIIGVAVFTGLTAYDVQTLKRIGAGIEYEGVSANDTKKMAIMGALRLYLDFINLFLMLLRLFGRRR